MIIIIIITLKFMLTTYHIFRSISQQLNTNTSAFNFNSFDLISKLPQAPYYNEYKFIPIIHKTTDIPQSGKYFNKEIGCADDIVYHSTREFNDVDNTNIVEYKALGFRDRLQNAMMDASRNILCAKSKYIVFTCN